MIKLSVATPFGVYQGEFLPSMRVADVIRHIAHEHNLPLNSPMNLCEEGKCFIHDDALCVCVPDGSRSLVLFNSEDKR